MGLGRKEDDENDENDDEDEKEEEEEEGKDEWVEGSAGIDIFSCVIVIPFDRNQTWGSLKRGNKNGPLTLFSRNEL